MTLTKQNQVYTCLTPKQQRCLKFLALSCCPSLQKNPGKECSVQCQTAVYSEELRVHPRNVKKIKTSQAPNHYGLARGCGCCGWDGAQKSETQPTNAVLRLRIHLKIMGMARTSGIQNMTNSVSKTKNKHYARWVLLEPSTNG